MELNDLKGKKISILGAGRTGIALARILGGIGVDLFLSESATRDKLNSTLEILKQVHAKMEFGGHTTAIYKDRDLIVISPGVPSNLEVLEDARQHGVEVIGEVELAYRLCKSPIIAITGTKGKSTSAVILHDLLEAHGIPSILAGNIGIPLIAELSRTGKDRWVVLEVSSFQLETVKRFKPRISAFLSFYPDHIDRHKSLDEYLRMKLRIFSCQSEDDYAVLNADDSTVMNITGKIKPGKLLYGISYRDGFSAYLSGDSMVIVRNGDKIRIKIKNDNLKGMHVRLNALAALLMASIAGADLSRAKQVLESFTPLPHRLEPVIEAGNILYVDDSKSTTPHSCRAALLSFGRPVILIAGGKDKGLDFSPLAEVLRETTHALILIGESADKIKRSAEKYGFTNIYMAKDIEEALHKSRKIARAGDVILLSPACSSFDMFKNAEERGETFVKLVMEMTGGIEK
ncbi:MAG: UDP-N-acetylmuramoyl-L-alanine--D-glutamate ligase [Candidatus Eremiobacteraeota bacterium]|nr:UDP-N-acetylmuramoyl-L-alanine--D-glutamate ligase [Candidatus Eremiobacteraeota bacterium]